MTDQVIERLKTLLYDITSYYAMQDYLKANTNKYGKRYKIHHAYSLSDQTKESLENYKLCFNNEILLEDESKIKAYILKQRILKLGIFKEM